MLDPQLLLFVAKQVHRHSHDKAGVFDLELRGPGFAVRVAPFALMAKTAFLVAREPCQEVEPGRFSLRMWQDDARERRCRRLLQHAHEVRELDRPVRAGQQPVEVAAFQRPRRRSGGFQPDGPGDNPRPSAHADLREHMGAFQGGRDGAADRLRAEGMLPQAVTDQSKQKRLADTVADHPAILGTGAFGADDVQATPEVDVADDPGVA